MRQHRAKHIVDTKIDTAVSDVIIIISVFNFKIQLRYATHYIITRYCYVAQQSELYEQYFRETYLAAPHSEL